MCNTLLKPLANLSATLKNLASGNGDLTQRLNEDGNDEISTISIQVNNFISTIHALIEDILHASNAISISSETLKKSNTANFKGDRYSFARSDQAKGNIKWLRSRLKGGLRSRDQIGKTRMRKSSKVTTKQIRQEGNSIWKRHKLPSSQKSLQSPVDRKI